jgi:transcription termination factor Rho
MSAVLDIDNLLESPLADLHALAGELDIDGYRMLRKSDLTIAILESRGAIGDEIRPAVEAKADELAKIKAEHEKALADQEERDEEAREAAAAERAARAPRQRSSTGGSSTGQRSGERSGSARGGRGGRGRGGRGGDGRRTERGERTDRKPRERGDAQTESKNGATAKSPERGGRGRGKKDEAAAPTASEPTVSLTGIFEPGSGGGGRLRTDIAKRVRADADVPRGEVRKWKLHRGDTIVGDARKMRRGRTDHQLVSISSVNGQTAEQRAGSNVRFADAEAAATGERFAKKLFKQAPIGAGSRVVVTGPTRAAASEMLRKLAGDLAGNKLSTTLVITASRPEDGSISASGYDVVIAEPGKPAEDVVPAIDLVIERGKRYAEGGANAVVLVDGLDLLPAEKANEIFTSARNLAGHGSLTIVGSAGAGSALEAQATSIGVVAGGRRLKLDKKASWSADS